MADQLMPGIDNTGETKRMVEGTMEQARTMAGNATEQVWSAAANASATAQDLAVKAREQTAIARDMLYQQGARASEYVNAYPLTALAKKECPAPRHLSGYLQARRRRGAVCR